MKSLQNQGFCVILDIDMYGLPRPSRLRQQAGFFYVFFCFFLLDVVSFPRFASETAIFRRLFVTSHSVRYTFVPHNQTPQPLLEPVFSLYISSAL